MNTPDIVLQILFAAGPYVAVCAAMVVCARLNQSRKSESARNQEALNQRAELVERRLLAAETALARVQSQLADLEDQARLSSGAPVKSWTNINRRTQAVRMLRAGEKPAQVAAELSMTPAEVELIRKVHSITSTASSIFSVGG
jgi:hypothetical protein